MDGLWLVTGGSRSGKSDFALFSAESLPGPRCFVATCPVLDPEMQRRVERHRRDRDPELWTTLEEPVDLAGALRAAQPYPTVLVDCLTLWINNLLYHHPELGEDDVAVRCAEVLRACADHPGTILLVTNEVGWGIVPADPLSRHYRDLVGRCNQTMAAAAGAVTLVSCGLPLWLKERKERCGSAR